MSHYLENTKHLSLELENFILTITLDNPKMRNAITTDMIDSIEAVLKGADRDEKVRVVVLTGAGNSFCAGGDLNAMENKSGMFAGNSAELRENYSTGIQRIPRAIEAFQKPIIGMINGAAIGAGCDLASMCDLRVGTTNSKFGETFSKLGLVPGDGGPYFLTRVVGYAKAMELYLTGDLINGDEALRIGLLNHLVNDDELESKTKELALKIAQNAPIAIQMTKQSLKSVRLADLNSHLDLMATYQGIAQRTDDHFEGIKAFKEKRSPKFEGK
ncbi:MAG: enoyl-CoA hydratase/isomerase family protein [Bacteriovoracaceae bacterium]|nr:enoyl-CoA hydratase/isomerase family protein [Bacteriovoracaceae bacterium]